MPNTNKQFKLNWAAYGSATKSAAPTQNKNSQQDIQIYVGDIDPLATEQRLL